MRTGGLTSSAPGEVSDIVLDTILQGVAGNTLHAKSLPYGPFAKRFFAPFIGGVYLGNTVREHFGEPIEVNATVGANTTGNFYLEDMGDWASMPDGAVLPNGGALEAEALNSKRLKYEWENSYNLTAPNGDTQLSNLAVTGAVRLQNVGVHPTPTRGRLYYTIKINPLVDDSGGDDDQGGNGGTSVSPNNFNLFFGSTRAWTVAGNTVDYYIGQVVRAFRAADHNAWMQGTVTAIAGSIVTIAVDTHDADGLNVMTNWTDWVLVTKSHYDYTVRFFADGTLVSESAHAVQVVANTASEVNSSDLGATFTLTYTADVTGLTAYFDIRWPAAFQIHYSIAALVFPRTAEFTVYDNGGDDYAYTSPNLAAGVYNCDVLQIDDEGNVESTAIPASVSETINSVPAAPTITSVTAAAHLGGVRLTVNWTNGETGCTTMLYYSDLDSPVNLFSVGHPTPIGPSAVNATSALIDLASVPPGIDFSTAYATMLTNIDSSVAALLASGFNLGEADYETEYPAVRDAIVSVIEIFGVAVGEDFDDQLTILKTASMSLEFAEANVSGLGFALADWQTAVGPYLAQYFSVLGSILNGDELRYYFADYPFTVLGDLITIEEQSAPLVQNNFLRIILRATKGGIQERHDAQFKIEFDGAAGTLVAARPNKPNIERFAPDFETIDIHASVIEDDAAASAIQILLFLVADIDSFDFTSPSDTQTLPAAFAGYHAVDLSGDASGDLGGTGKGWVKFCVRAKAASGQLSDEPQGDDIKRVYIGQTVGAVRSFTVDVQSGLGLQ